MDSRLDGPLNSSNEFQWKNQSMTDISNWGLGNGPRLEITYPDQKLVNGHSFEERSIGGTHLLPNGTLSTLFVDIEDDNHNDRDLSDGILRYIDRILMEEDMEDKTRMLQESLDFQAKERSFYELLGEKYPPFPLQESALGGQYCERPDYNYSYVNHHNSTTSSRDGSRYLIDVVDPSWFNTRTDYDDYITNYVVSNASVSSSNSLNSLKDRFSDSTMSHLQVGDMYSESQVVLNFRKGVDDASKFLPSGSKMLGIDSLLVKNLKEGGETVENDEVNLKSSCSEENDWEEERSDKLSANVPIEEFDDVWIYTLGWREKEFAAYILTDLQNAACMSMQPSGEAKQNRKKEVIDLISLLMGCAHSIAADDFHAANELLRQIRRHSSPFGDGNQRLAHYFADGLKARLAGPGSQIHKALVYERTTASDYVIDYCCSLVFSPFRKIWSFASNKMIMIKSEKATRVHIIDFGIYYGFQWPTFIQSVAEREGGPPKLRITAVDFPQAGSRPAGRIEDTGRRLAHYAKMFDIPFEFNAISQNWGTIKLEDLKIDKDEFVAVNLSYRAKSLTDETSCGESSRTMVLNLIRKINPDIFIHGIVHGAYSVPFFVPRFRELLFHFSALFDMLETTIPRERPERMLVERDVFGNELLNVIACEGWERAERPETYKQWQMRHLRAGFMQVPLEKRLMDTIMHKVSNFYHREFVLIEDNQWLLMSWKGRIIYAISCWQPV